jgi:hypothetical protein
LVRAVPIQQAAADHPYRIVGAELLQKRRDTILDKKGVGIQKQYKLALGAFDPNIVGGRKPDILAASQKSHMWEVYGNCHRAIVARRIVDDNYLRGDIRLDELAKSF